MILCQAVQSSQSKCEISASFGRLHNTYSSFENKEFWYLTDRILIRLARQVIVRHHIVYIVVTSPRPPGSQLDREGGLQESAFFICEACAYGIICDEATKTRLCCALPSHYRPPPRRAYSNNRKYHMYLINRIIISLFHGSKVIYFRL